MQIEIPYISPLLPPLAAASFKRSLVRQTLLKNGRDPDELVDPSGRTVLDEALSDGS